EHPLLLTLRELAEGPVRESSDAGFLESSFESLAVLEPAAAQERRAALEPEAHHVAHAERVRRVELTLLSEIRPAHAGRNRHATRDGPLEAEQCPRPRRLARAVPTEDAPELPSANREIEGRQQRSPRAPDHERLARNQDRFRAFGRVHRSAPCAQGCSGSRRRSVRVTAPPRAPSRFRP